MFQTKVIKNNNFLCKVTFFFLNMYIVQVFKIIFFFFCFSKCNAMTFLGFINQIEINTPKYYLKNTFWFI